MRRAVFAVTGLLLVAGGALLGLYGLFAILYEGDAGGGDTYVTFGGREVDADLAGAVALIIGFLAVGLAVWVFGRRRRHPAKAA